MTTKLSDIFKKSYGLEDIKEPSQGWGFIYWVYCKQCPDTRYFWGIDQSREKMERLRTEHMEQNPGHHVIMSWFDWLLP